MVSFFWLGVEGNRKGVREGDKQSHCLSPESPRHLGSFEKCPVHWFKCWMSIYVCNGVY